MNRIIPMILSIMLITPPVFSSEVIPETNTKVIVREHSKTGEPYVSIISLDEPQRNDLLSKEDIPYPRPDYRMLEKGVSPKDVGYEGPYSSKKKIYILAASLATIGTVGAVAGAAAFPAAASTGAAGSAAGPGIGAAVSGLGTAGAVKLASGSDLPDDFVRADETTLVEEANTDFYRMYVHGDGSEGDRSNQMAPTDLSPSEPSPKRND